MPAPLLNCPMKVQMIILNPWLLEQNIWFCDLFWLCLLMRNFMFSLGSDVVFNISLPRKGTYYYSIFACDTDQADVYNNVISIKITCSDVSVLQLVSGKMNYFLCWHITYKTCLKYSICNSFVDKWDKILLLCLQNCLKIELLKFRLRTSRSANSPNCPMDMAQLNLPLI